VSSPPGIFARPTVFGGGWVCGCRRQPHKSKVSVRVLSKIDSNFIQKIPPVGRWKVWFAFCEGSPATSFSDWRCVFEKIRTDFLNGFGGRKGGDFHLPNPLIKSTGRSLDVILSGGWGAH